MRYLKYTTAVFLILGILAVVLYFFRAPIVRKLANSALTGQGISVTELSLDAPEFDRIRVPDLVIEQSNGTRYRISGLSLPVSFPVDRSGKIVIDSLRIKTADGSSTPVSLAYLLQTFLRLPDSLSKTELSMTRFSMPDAPPLDHIVWRSANRRQHLSFDIGPVGTEVDVEPVDTDDYRATIKTAVANSSDALILTIAIHRNGNGFTIDGMSEIRLAPWLPVLRSAGILPDDIASLDASLGGPISMTLDDDGLQPVLVNAQLSIDDDLDITYGTHATDAIRARISSPDSFQIGLEYPALDWTAKIARIDVIAEAGPGNSIPLQLDDLRCRPGILCTVQASMDTGPLKLGSLTIARARLSAELEIAADKVTQVDIAPDPGLVLTGVESANFSLESIRLKQFSGARLSRDDSGWRGTINRVALAIDPAAGREHLGTPLPVILDKLRFHDDGTAINASISIPPNSTAVIREGFGIILPGLDGTVSLQHDNLSASLALHDSHDSLSAQIEVAHRLASGQGTLRVHDGKLLFDQEKLSGHLLKWPYAWDVLSGTLRTELELNWKIDDDGADYKGTMTLDANALAGHYTDVAFSGLNTGLRANLDSTKGMTLSPASLEIALLDIGIPVKQIETDFTLDVRKQRMLVRHLSMSTLGGQLMTEPFSFDMRADKNDIILRPQSIQLQFMIDLLESKDIKISGSISGVIPMTIRDKTITITNGRLYSDPPGGAIHYLPGVDAENTQISDSGLNLVTQTLSNFRFDSLTSDVDYTENGDLKLQMRLTGRNPDMDDRQPVILNLGVENNIPKLLRSLQATRSIEEILEKNR